MRRHRSRAGPRVVGFAWLPCGSRGPAWSGSSDMAKQALIIGGAGFLGTGVVKELQAAGWRVTSLGRGRKQNTVSGVNFIPADRQEPGALARAIEGQRFDLVVDCAAYQRPDA